MLRKCQAYIQLWATGKEAVFPCVLWVANRTGRASALVRCLKELPEQPRQLFAVCEMAGFVATIAWGALAQKAIRNQVEEEQAMEGEPTQRRQPEEQQLPPGGATAAAGGGGPGSPAPYLCRQFERLQLRQNFWHLAQCRPGAGRSATAQSTRHAGSGRRNRTPRSGPSTTSKASTTRRESGRTSAMSAG